MDNLFQIETERLIIRLHTLADLLPYQEMQANSKVMEMIPAKKMSFKESEDFLKHIIREYQNPSPEKSIYAIELKSDSSFIGNCAIIYLRKDPEIGYRLKEKFWNNGYATEITQALIAHLFTSTNYTKIIADCAVDNIGSTKVLSKFMQKVGESFNQTDNCQDYHFELTKLNFENSLLQD